MNAAIAISVGNSAPRNKPIVPIDSSWKPSRSRATPAGLGALAMMVSPPPATAPGRRRDYGLRPRDVAPTPQSPVADAMPERIEMNLEFDIAAQQADGSWLPNWTWSDRYPEVWPQARREWQGVLTLRRLQSLKAYGRVG